MLTVSRMNTPLESSPASVSVIDREMIRNSGAREIADIFRLVPGFVIGYRRGHTPTVTYHGLGDEFQRQLQVLVDGRSVFIPSFGGVPWSNLPLLLEDIERVEITRGPNAVTYGANAFLATVNIITRHPAEDVETRITATQGLHNNSETRDLYFKVGNQVGDLDWRLTAGREKDDGYASEHDSKQINKLNLRTDFLSDSNRIWTVQAGINQSAFDRGDGREIDVFRSDDTTNSYQNIRLEIPQVKSSTILKLTHTQQDLDDQYLTDPLNEILGIPTVGVPDIIYQADISRLSQRLDLEIYQNQRIGPDTTVNYGASIRQDRVNSFFLFHDRRNHRVDTERLFSSLEWKATDGLTFDLGLMLEDTDLTEPQLSHRFSIIQKIDHQHHLRLVSSRAKRNPVLYEVEGDIHHAIELPAILGPSPLIVPAWTGNANLLPETIDSLELGLFSTNSLRQLSTDLKLFSYRISDQITDVVLLESIIDLVTRQNQGKTSVTGLEASLNYSPRHKRYRLYGGLTQLTRVDVEKTLEWRALDYKASFPELTAFAGGHIDFDTAHQLSFGLYYKDQMSWLDSGHDLDRQTRLDLRYRYLINKKQDTHLELIGYNLENRDAEYVNYNPNKGSLLLRISSRL